MTGGERRRPPASLLFIKPGSLGDIVHALPVTAVIHAEWPETQITWLVDQRWSILLKGNPNVSKILEFPRQDFRGAGFLRSIPWIFSLKKIQPDIAIDLQGLLRSSLMAFASGAKSVHGLGDAREGARWFYNTRTEPSAHQHAVTRYLGILSDLGIGSPAEPQFFLPPGIPPKIKIPKDFVLLHPYARGENKSLTPQFVEQFCREYKGLPIVIAGHGPSPSLSHAHVQNLLNSTSLEELIWLIRNARFVISVDSGPMHIAAALTANLLSIHTWSDPREVGPYNESAWIWQGGNIRLQRLDREPALQKSLTPNDITRIAKWVESRVS